MSLLPAARVTDPFGHTLALEGLVAGIALGALLGAAVAATGGLAAALIGATIAVGGGEDLGKIGEMLGSQLLGPTTGVLTTGSPNVRINDLPATMMTLATGECLWHDGVPQPVASGAKRVLINGMPAARVTDTLVCGAIILRGSASVFIGGPTQSPICAKLIAELAAFDRFQIDAEAAAAAYDPPDQRIPPAGYRNATDADLAKLGLDQRQLEHPFDEKQNKPSEFRAAVFINNNTGKALVAYKGTTSKADWNANIDQLQGKDTFYYNQAQYIARRVAQSPGGSGAQLTGHSLGGGLASAGAEASGLPATTFNAAGLNAQTVPHPTPTNIDAIHVDGEILTTAQSLPFVPKAAATRSWTLEPVDHPIRDAILLVRAGKPYKAAKGLAIRRKILHGMDQVQPALAGKQSLLRESMTKNGCL